MKVVPGMVHILNDRMRDRMAGWDDHNAQQASTIGNIPRVTRRLSNLSHLSLGETGRFLRKEGLLLSHI